MLDDARDSFVAEESVHVLALTARGLPRLFADKPSVRLLGPLPFS